MNSNPPELVKLLSLGVDHQGHDLKIKNLRTASNPSQRVGKIRDSQKSKLYKAEKVLPSIVIGKKELLTSQAYVDKVWTSVWTKKHFQRSRLYRSPMCADGRGRRNATGNLIVLQLPRWARTKATVLHELAHSLTGERPAHGWQFARNYLLLVQHFLGPEAAKALRTSYRKERVRYNPPRKLSLEIIDKLREHAKRVFPGHPDRHQDMGHVDIPHSLQQESVAVYWEQGGGVL